MLRDTKQRRKLSYVLAPLMTDGALTPLSATSLFLFKRSVLHRGERFWQACTIRSGVQHMQIMCACSIVCLISTRYGALADLLGKGRDIAALNSRAMDETLLWSLLLGRTLFGGEIPYFRGSR